MNADLLDFDVSDRAEKSLEGYIQQTNHEGNAPVIVTLTHSGLSIVGKTFPHGRFWLYPTLEDNIWSN